MPRERIHHGQTWVYPAKPTAREHNGPEATAWLYRPGVTMEEEARQMPPGAVLIEDPSMDVSWQPESSEGAGDGHIQFIVEIPTERLRRRVTELNDETAVSFGFDVIDRPKSNRILRLLRRARNAAYGDDE